MFNETFWTLSGKVLICLYKALQLTVHVRTNENHEVKELPKELRDRVVARHRSGSGYKTSSAALEIPQITMVSKKEIWNDHTVAFTKPDSSAKLGNCGRGALMRDVQ